MDALGRRSPVGNPWQRDSGRLGLIPLVVLAVALPGCSPDLRWPAVLLITVDTLRADHLGAYGYSLDTSPSIDTLAERGVLFRDCTAPWPKTWPSIASLLTGMYPRTTGVTDGEKILRPGLLTLAEIMRSVGYTTAAVVTNANIGRAYGYHRGFEHFSEPWRSAPDQRLGPARVGRLKEAARAEIVTDEALAWLRAVPDATPFFLWLHYIDPHGPYLPPADHRKLFPGAHTDEGEIPVVALPPYQTQRDPVTQEPILDLGFYVAQYDREIRYLDAEVGRLLDGLRILGLERDTIVILSADHGESLGEHGLYLEHGRLPYQPSAHVPLVVVWEAGKLEPGRVVDTPVGLIDVPKTILELIGLGATANMEGRSFAPLLRDGPSIDHGLVFMESGLSSIGSQLSVRQGPWKLIVVRSPEDLRIMHGSEVELYDVVRDPEESRNVASSHPELVRALRKALRTWRREQTSRAAQQPSIPDEATREMLEELGYLE